VGQTRAIRGELVTVHVAKPPQVGLVRKCLGHTAQSRRWLGGWQRNGEAALELHSASTGVSFVTSRPPALEHPNAH